MDILIKNMKLPKNCRSCPLIYETSREFTCWQIMKKWPIKEAEHRQEGCPLVALPEHGDLIDRQAVLSYFETAFLMGADMDYEDIVGIVSNPKAIPTIVEANYGTDN